MNKIHVNLTYVDSLISFEPGHEKWHYRLKTVVKYKNCVFLMAALKFSVIYDSYNQFCLDVSWENWCYAIAVAFADIGPERCVWTGSREIQRISCVIVDETWIHHYKCESKEQSSAPKKAKTFYSEWRD